MIEKNRFEIFSRDSDEFGLLDVTFALSSPQAACVQNFYCYQDVLLEFANAMRVFFPQNDEAINFEYENKEHYYSYICMNIQKVDMLGALCISVEMSDNDKMYCRFPMYAQIVTVNALGTDMAVWCKGDRQDSFLFEW